MINQFGPDIVIVDDKENEISEIKKLLIEQGIGVRYFNADTVDGDDVPENNISTVKMIFIDFYYNENFDAEIVAGWLDAIVPENHFYFLIAWSKHPEKLDEVLEELKNINKEPLFCHQTSKKDFLSNPVNYSFNDLLESINEKLDNVKGARELMLWKKGISQATSNVLASITKEKKSIEEKIKKIIFVQGGKNIRDAKAEEKLECLYDALDYVLHSNSKNFRDLSLLKLNGSICESSITNRIMKYKDPEINSWFLLKKTQPRNILNESGEIYHLKDLDMIEKYSITKYKTFKDFYDYDNNKGNIYHIGVLITPSCDLSQNKHGDNLKFISGLVINTIPRDKDNNIMYNNSKYVKPESLKIIDNIDLSMLNLKNGTLVLDLRYTFSVTESEVKNAENYIPLSVLSKDLISDIQTSYASHSSRIGYLFM